MIYKVKFFFCLVNDWTLILIFGQTDLIGMQCFSALVVDWFEIAIDLIVKLDFYFK